MRDKPPVVTVVVIAKVVSSGRVVHGLIRGANLVLYSMLVKTTATPVRRLVDAPHVDYVGPALDADAAQFDVAVPGNVRCIPAPAFLARQGVTKAEEREEDRGGDGEEHLGRLQRLLRLVYKLWEDGVKETWWIIVAGKDSKPNN